MPDDIEVIEKTEPVTGEAPEQAVSEGTPETEQPPQPQYLTKEEAANLIAEAVKQAKEVGRREMQSEKDREVYEAQRKAREAEAELNLFNEHLKDLDPDTQKDLTIARFQKNEQTRKQLEQEQAQQAQVQATINYFRQTNIENAKELGISPEDKRLDWGADSESLSIRNDKFWKSVAKIQKDAQKSRDAEIKKRVDEEIARVRKEMGLESVENVPAASSGSDADFLKKFADGTLPMTKANLDRYHKMLNE